MPESQNIKYKSLWKDKYSNKWDNENMKFRNPFVFVNFIEELSQYQI
jgi:hypothetical protein